MIFLRTTSSGFNHAKKSAVFNSSLHNSLQFGGHRAVIINTPFSYYINLTAGYTFKSQDVAVTPSWSGFTECNFNFVAESLFVGVGLKYAEFVYNGSGDSGDFDRESIDYTIDTIERQYGNSRGMCDSSDPNHDLHMRARPRREFVQGILVERVGGCQSLNDLVEHCAYWALESQYGGWENNEGANGSVSIDKSGLNIIYEQGYYNCDNCGEDYSEDEPCDCISCPECYVPVTEGEECAECDKVCVKCKVCDDVIFANEDCDSCIKNASVEK